MAEERDAVLKLPAQPKLSTREAVSATRVLSLTGGGYRGLFTAQVIVELCDLARRQAPLDRVFDVFAGTSIGGLMACALAIGVRPRRVLDAIDAHGGSVFPKKRQRTARRVFFGSLYDSDNLAKAVDSALGQKASIKLKDLRTGLLVPAINWVSGTTELFQSAAFGKAHASDATLRDVCLATSAAPTYFKPHEVDGAELLDGGLIANNPDTITLLEVARRWPARLGQVQMLSIGTAGTAARGEPRKADKSGLKWASALPEFMISVQELTAAAQAQRILGKRYLRLNHVPVPGVAAFERLDLADDKSRQALLEAASAAAKAAYRAHRAFVDRILSPR